MTATSHEKCVIVLNGPDIVDFNIENDLGETPLHLATKANNKEIVSKLIEFGAYLYLCFTSMAYLNPLIN